MRDFKGTNFADRLKAAAKAKQALQQRVKTLPGINDPEVVAKRAARQAANEAKEAERARREAIKAEEARVQAEKAAAEKAAAEAEAARKANDEASKIAQLLADQKAARDARYAARKARSKK